MANFEEIGDPALRSNLISFLYEDPVIIFVIVHFELALSFYLAYFLLK